MKSVVPLVILSPGSQPHRVRMAHNLIVNYGLYKHMEVFVSGAAGERTRGWAFPTSRGVCRAQKPVLVDAMEMTRFHTDDYVNFLRTVTPDNMHDHLRSLKRWVQALRLELAAPAPEAPLPSQVQHW